jgi:hypothetical protein
MNQVSPPGGKPLARLGKPLARIVAQDGGGQIGDIALMLPKLLADDCFHAKRKIVQALSQPMQQRIHAPFGAADGQAGEPLAGLQQLKAGGALQPMRLLGHALGNLVLRLGNQFGGGGWRGGAQVGDKIGNREVGLVAYRETTARLLDAIARATRSLLKAARSSSEPPPRATTITSTRPTSSVR